MLRYLRLAPLCMLCACNGATGLYQWGGYESRLLEYYKAPSDAKFTEDLKKTVEEAEQAAAKPDAKARKVAPGLYAEYGYMLLKQGRKEQALPLFRKERAGWPESAVLMTALERSAQGKKLFEGTDAKPSGGELKPDVPAKPSGGELKPDVPAKPSGGELKPDVPAKPSGGELKPDVPAKPSGGELKPDVPAKPSGGELKPDVPAKPSGGELKPDVPAKPSGGDLPKTSSGGVPAVSKPKASEGDSSAAWLKK